RWTRAAVRSKPKSSFAGLHRSRAPDDTESSRCDGATFPAELWHWPIGYEEPKGRRTGGLAHDKNRPAKPVDDLKLRRPHRAGSPGARPGCAERHSYLFQDHR